MIKLQNKQKDTICVSELKDGQIAEIVLWANVIHIGKIVQRYGDSLVVIGSTRGDSWPSCFGGEWHENNSYRLRPLKVGESLEII